MRANDATRMSSHLRPSGLPRSLSPRRWSARASIGSGNTSGESRNGKSLRWPWRPSRIASAQRTKLSGYSCELGSQPHPGHARDLDFFRALEALARQVHSKRLGQASLSRRGQPQRAAVTLADEPTQTQTAPPDLRAHKTRDMISALAPVETGSAEDAFAARAQVRAEFGQKARARIRHLAPVLGEDDVSIGDERIGDGDADLAGQVIVASAREAKRVISKRTRLIARRHLDRRNRNDAFKHPRDQGRRDAIVAIAPLLGDRDETRLDELEEVLAGVSRDHGRPAPALKNLLIRVK